MRLKERKYKLTNNLTTVKIFKLLTNVLEI